MLSAKYNATANFATSEGCMERPPISIQRVAWLRVVPTPGTSTRASRMMATNSAGLERALKRW